MDLVDAIDVMNGGDDGPLRRLVKPIEAGLTLLPKMWVRDSAVDAVCTGAALAMPGILRLESGISRGSMVAVMTQKGEGVALMKAEASGEEIVGSEHGIAATPVRVLMPRGTYPKMW